MEAFLVVCVISLECFRGAMDANPISLNAARHGLDALIRYDSHLGPSGSSICNIHDLVSYASDVALHEINLDFLVESGVDISQGNFSHVSRSSVFCADLASVAYCFDCLRKAFVEDTSCFADVLHFVGLSICEAVELFRESQWCTFFQHANVCH